MDIDQTPPADPHDALKKQLKTFFQRIDDATNAVLDLMQKKGFEREGLQMVMLGLPNELYLNGKVPKKVDHGAPGEIQVDLFDSGHGRGRGLNYNVVNLKILNNGITDFLTMPDPHSDEEIAHLKNVTHSTVNEIALYKALAKTARRALGIVSTGEERQTVKALKKAVDELEQMSVGAVTFTPELPFSLWKEHIAQRVEVYEKHFQAKRAKSQVTEDQLTEAEPQVTQPNRDGVIDLDEEKKRRSGVQ